MRVPEFLKTSLQFNKGEVIADVVAVLFALYYFFTSQDLSPTPSMSHEDNALYFIIILTAIPWYGGYLLFQFDSFNKYLRRVLQWIMAIIILALIVFFILILMPMFENNPNPSAYQVFLISFGMFFLVLGPMMLLGGYNDQEFLNQQASYDKPIIWPSITMVLFILIIAILFMILIIGHFDPTWEGNAGFGVVMLGYLGGPVIAVILCVPIIYLGKWIEKADKHRIVIKSLQYFFPLVVFSSLYWWNDIVINHIIYNWGVSKPSAALILWSMVLGGIIPFRLLLLTKPPLRVISLFFGFLSSGIYILGVLKSYGALY